MLTIRYEPEDSTQLLNNKSSEIIKNIIIDDNHENQKIHEDFTKPNDFSLRSSQLTIKMTEPSLSSETPDLLEFVQVRKFSESTNSSISSPRDSHIELTEQDFCVLPQYNDTHKWFDNNIKRYLKDKSHWPRHIYPERLLYIYGPRGMGRLTHTMFTCQQSGMNLLFVPSSIHDTGLYAKIVKKAKELQPCVIFFDDFDSIFVFPPCLQQLYAIMNSQLNKRDDDVWIVITGNHPPEALPPSAKSMITEYGSITDVNAIESIDQARDLIFQMLNTISARNNYPCSQEELGNPYNRWNNVLSVLSTYTQYCTIKELKTFFIKLFQSYYNIREDSGSYLPPMEAFNQAIDEIPFIDDKSDLKSLAVSRNAMQDYGTHENAWNLYTAVSGIKTSSRTSTPSCYSSMASFSPLPSVPHSTIPSISREEQRGIERERRRQQQINAATETMMQGDFDFSSLSLPSQNVPPTISRDLSPPSSIESQSIMDTYCPSSPSHSIFNNNNPSPLSNIPQSLEISKLPPLPIFPLPLLPPPSSSPNIITDTPKKQINDSKKRPPPVKNPILSFISSTKSSSSNRESLLKRLKK